MSGDYILFEHEKLIDCLENTATCLDKSRHVLMCCIKFVDRLLIRNRILNLGLKKLIKRTNPIEYAI